MTRGGLELHGFSPETVDDAVLVQNELITNALTHGAPPVMVHLEIVGARIRLAVTDSGHGRAMVREPDATGGRGLSVVQALTSGWGYELAGDGHAVWADIPGDSARV